MYHISLCDEAKQSDIFVKGGTNGVEWRKRRRGATTFPTIPAIPLLSHTVPSTTVCTQQAQCAHNRQVQHTKIHQFTGDRTANTKCGNQHRLQFQAFYVMFCSRHSSGDADQLVLSTVLGTLDSRPSALFGITEYEMLFVGDYNSDWTAYKTC